MANPLLLLLKKELIQKVVSNVINSVVSPKDGVSPEKTGTKTAIAAAPVVGATAAIGTGAITTGDPLFDVVMTCLGAIVSYVLVVYREHE